MIILIKPLASGGSLCFRYLIFEVRRQGMSSHYVSLTTAQMPTQIRTSPTAYQNFARRCVNKLVGLQSINKQILTYDKITRHR